MIFLTSTLERDSAKLLDSYHHRQKSIQGDIEHRHSSKSSRNSILVRWSILTLLVFTTGCNRDKLLKETDEFDKAMNTGATAIAAYYTKLNEQEYDLYFQLLKLYPNCEVGDRVNYGCINPKWRQGEGEYSDSPLKKPPFPLESIQARIELLKGLTTYSKSLVALAGDDSPAQFQGNIKTLTSSLSSLKSSFQQLQNERQNPDLTAKQYISPLGTIVGTLASSIFRIFSGKRYARLLSRQKSQSILF